MGFGAYIGYAFCRDHCGMRLAYDRTRISEYYVEGVRVPAFFTALATGAMDERGSRSSAGRDALSPGFDGFHSSWLDGGDVLVAYSSAVLRKFGRLRSRFSATAWRKHIRSMDRFGDQCVVV